METTLELYSDTGAFPVLLRGARMHSCTRARGPPVALHVSQQISLESWGFSGVAAVSRYTPPKRPCRTCRPRTARSVARQAASERVSRYRGV